MEFPRSASIWHCSAQIFCIRSGFPPKISAVLGIEQSASILSRTTRPRSINQTLCIFSKENQSGP